MPPPDPASLDPKDILGMLDGEEIATLRTRLGTVAVEGFADLAEFSPARLLIEVVKLRLPFIRMMGDIAGLLGDLETSIRGNVRFIVLPDAELELHVDFGPQMRSAIAKALNEKLLVDHDEQIATRSKLFAATSSARQ